MLEREGRRSEAASAPVAEVVAAQLEGRVAELSGLLNATHAALIEVIAEVVATESWAGGYRSPEHWVSLHCGLSRGRAALLVAAARRIDALPEVAARFRAGEMSVDQAAAVLSRAPAESDARMAEMAPLLSMSQLRQTLAALPPIEPEASTEPETEPRHLSGHFTDAGTFVLRGEMPGDCGALFEKAMRAVRTDLLDRKVSDIDSVSALERILNLALDSLDPSARRGEGRGDRYQVMLHLDRTVDAASTRVQPHLGTWLPAGLSRYLTCDSTVRLALYDTDQEGARRLVGFSPQARVVDPKTRAAIEHRDRGCRVLGCEQRSWLHIHHILHWENGGPTEAWNLVALCPHHHRQHHQGLITIQGDSERSGGLQVLDKWARPVGTSPPTPPEPDLRRVADRLDVPRGTGWSHPWGQPLDKPSYVWT
jgi:hypothetical protein